MSFAHDDIVTKIKFAMLRSESHGRKHEFGLTSTRGLQKKWNGTCADWVGEFVN